MNEKGHDVRFLLCRRFVQRPKQLGHLDLVVQVINFAFDGLFQPITRLGGVPREAMLSFDERSAKYIRGEGRAEYCRLSKSLFAAAGAGPSLTAYDGTWFSTSLMASAWRDAPRLPPRRPRAILTCTGVLAVWFCVPAQELSLAPRLADNEPEIGLCLTRVNILVPLRGERVMNRFR